MTSGRLKVAWLGAFLASGLFSAPVFAGSATIQFSGQVPERGREALTVIAAGAVSLSGESGLRFVSRNTSGKTVRRVFSVSSMAGKAMAAEIQPASAVMRPGAVRRVSVFVPFGSAMRHRYNVCVQSFDMAGAALGRVCQTHAARRVQ